MKRENSSFFLSLSLNCIRVERPIARWIVIHLFNWFFETNWISSLYILVLFHNSIVFEIFFQFVIFLLGLRLFQIFFSHSHSLSLSLSFIHYIFNLYFVLAIGWWIPASVWPKSSYGDVHTYIQTDNHLIKQVVNLTYDSI